LGINNTKGGAAVPKEQHGRVSMVFGTLGHVKGGGPESKWRGGTIHPNGQRLATSK